MADDITRYFRNGSNFETTPRSISVSEAKTQIISVVGIYDDLKMLDLRTGDRIPAFVMDNNNLYIQNVTLQRTEGNMGEMSISCVEVENPDMPFSVTIDIDMSEVSHKLINHPLMRDAKTQNQIRLWSNTDPTLQFDKDGNPTSGFSLSDGKPASTPVKLDDGMAIRFANSSALGVDSYNTYLPVVTRTSRYLKFPGLRIDHVTHAASGVLNPDGLENLGDFDNPPVQVEHYRGGIWFKSGDKFTQSADGTWSRTENWTYTNDLRFTWIYQDGAAKEVIDEEGR